VLHATPALALQLYDGDRAQALTTVDFRPHAFSSANAWPPP
ncbi:MAG: hypothetical protein V7640_1180, partial [Betaproteobacteria bacterium]